MTKHGNAFIIRGTVRDPQDLRGVAGLTVEALDQHLGVDRRLGTAKTDEHGQFELRYAGKDFATAFLQAKPTLYLQVKNPAGEVVHMSTTPIVHEAVAVKGLVLEIPRGAVASAAVEHTRAFFKQIVGINPNYFGGALATGLPQLSPVSQSTQFEELGCIGLSPHDDTLEAIVTIKLPYGYGGGLCEPGTKEYVAFFIDYGDGAGFVPAGAPVEVRVHDLMATGDGELHYAVRRAFTPAQLYRCKTPQVVKLRAILSWEAIPSNPHIPPVWGDVKEAWIQIRPYSLLLPWILPSGSEFALVGDLQTIKATAEASLQAVAAQAASSKLELERKQLLPLLSKNPNYFGSLSKATRGPKLLEELSKFPAVAGLDPGLLEPVVPQFPFSTRYEELTCVGLYPEVDLLEATFLVKQSLGYSGDLCTTGSVEYVAFYVDFGGGFEHVGTDKVPVHDIPAAMDRNLSYAAKVKLVDIQGKLRECTHENIVTVRAVLSWNYDPTPFGPGYTPPWGNVLDRRVQLRPITGPNAVGEIELVSEIHVDEIAQSGPDLGYAIAPGSPPPPMVVHNRPFGGYVAIHGKIEVPGATRYRFLFRPSGGSWEPVRDPRYARHPLPWLSPIVRMPDADGWFSIVHYKEDLDNYSLTPLLHWPSHGKNGPYQLRLELGDDFGPIPGQSDEVDVHLDNEDIEFFQLSGSLPALPMIGVAVLDAGGAPKKCDTFRGNEPIRVFGNFRDDHFAAWSVRVAGGNLAPSGVLVAAAELAPSGAIVPSVPPGPFPIATFGVGPTGVVGAGPGTAGQPLVAFDLCSLPQSPQRVRCAYVVSLSVRDRAIVGYVSGHAFGTRSHSGTVYVTFDWDPAGQC